MDVIFSGCFAPNYGGNPEAQISYKTPNLLQSTSIHSSTVPSVLWNGFMHE
jgi:hypothetical protein